MYKYPNGGKGLSVDITGTNIGYGGGGGGSEAYIYPQYFKGIGNDGGGNGAGNTDTRYGVSYATAGRNNSGGGGGGGYWQFLYNYYYYRDNSAGGNGGSGIIIIKYQDVNNIINIKKKLTEPEYDTIYTNNNTNIINKIKETTDNIKELNNFKNNDYLLEKNNYINKINLLNTLKKEFNNTQDTLNISIKLYNEQYKKYNLYKKNAIYIIILLIIIVVSILLISIFPLFSNITNNIIYTILLIPLILITYFYNKQNTEKFDTIGSITKIITNQDINKHKNTYNKLLPYINEYSNAYNDLLNNLRQNMYTIGNKTFSQDANIYLYNIYLEKKKQVENNKNKSTKLFNFIEIIKKHIHYLSNIIKIISYFSIILLISLIIYSFIPYLYIFIIIIIAILISILMIYFAFAIIQPTRMIAEKKYWASVNPSSKTIIMI